MSIESTDEGANGEYFEVLHILIPRYLRVIEANKEDAFNNLRLRLGERSNLLHLVKWFKSADFFSLPGYISIKELDSLSCGLFSFDIASACAVNALGLNVANKSQNILDLCCCPGGKTQLMYDLLDRDTFFTRQSHEK